MRRTDWNWDFDSSQVANVASMHVCLALLRIYRDVNLPGEKHDSSAIAAPFWPLLRHHAKALLTALQAYAPRGADGDALAHDPNFLEACKAAVATNEPLPRDPPGNLRVVAQALILNIPSFRSLLDALEKSLEVEVASHPLDVEPTLRVLSELLELSNHEEAFLRLAAAVGLSSIDSSAFVCASGPRLPVQGVRAALRMPDDLSARHMFRRNGPLRRSGLLAECRDNGGDLQDRLTLSKRGWQLLDSRCHNLAQMADLILQKLPEAVEANLEWPHLQEATGLLASLLGNAVRNEATGVNILVYGPPGTGKTQYVQQLVRRAGAIGFSVSDCDSDGDAATREERLASLMLTQLFAAAGQTVIVLDEAEDVFKTDYVDPLARALGQKEESKAWMNGLLEGNRHPVIWISNRVGHLDPAYLRRFAYCLEVPKPPRSVREEIARRYLEPAGCSRALVRELAEAPDATPGLLGSTARAVMLATPDIDPDTAARSTLRGMLKVVGATLHAAVPERATRFDLRYLNIRGRILPEQVMEALRRSGRGCVVLDGSPGTGKTQLAAEIAKRSDRQLVYRTASDLNSMWFGQSEQNVAEMFRECDVEREMLFLDEADALLGSRESAGNRAEHAVTAEFLRHMESFRGIFVCATNHRGQFDAALSRRFEFRLEFLPLSARQRCELFSEVALGWHPDSGSEPPIEPQLRMRLDRLDQATPGDFANMCRRVKALGLSLTAEEWLDELESEHRAKPGASNGGIGFL